MPDLKVSQLPATAITDDDLLLIINDPLGSPGSKVASVGTLLGGVRSDISDIESKVGTTMPGPETALTTDAAGAPQWLPIAAVPSIGFRSSGGDDYARLQALLDLVDEGTYIFLPDLDYQFSAELLVHTSNIYIVGRGMGAAGNSTVLRRITNTGGAVIRWGVPSATTTPIGSTLVSGGGLRGVTIDAASKADYALQIKVADQLIFETLWLQNAVVADIDTATLSNAGALDVYNRNERLQFRNCYVYTASGAAVGIRIGGNATNTAGGQNTYVSTLSGITFNCAGTGLQINDADDIFLYQMSFGGAGAIGIELNGGAVGCARNCHFFGVLTGTSHSIIARATGFTNPSRDNTIYGLSNEDGQPTITIEPGAILAVVDGRGASTLIPAITTAPARDDFYGGSDASGQIGEMGWVSDGTGQTIAAIGVTDHPGVRRFALGAVAANKGILHLSVSTNQGMFVPAQSFDGTFVFRINQTGVHIKARVGFGLDQIVDPPADGIYLEKLYADNNWYAVCRASGTETRVQLDAVSTGWVRVRIRRRNSTTIGISIGEITNEVDVAKITTNIPTVALNPFYSVYTDEAVAKSLDVDLFHLQIRGLNR